MHGAQDEDAYECVVSSQRECDRQCTVEQIIGMFVFKRIVFRAERSTPFLRFCWHEEVPHDVWTKGVF